MFRNRKARWVLGVIMTILLALATDRTHIIPHACGLILLVIICVLLGDHGELADNYKDLQSSNNLLLKERMKKDES